MYYLYRNKFTGRREVIIANDVYELLSKNFDKSLEIDDWKSYLLVAVRNNSLR